MKNKPFYYQDNRALYEKRLSESTRVAISRRNIEFILAHQRDTLDELSRYLRRVKYELGHVPAQAEVIGGDLLALRFGSWVKALEYSGYMNCTGLAVRTLALEDTRLFRAEYERQAAQHAQEKKDRKKAAEAARRERKSEKKQEKKAAEKNTAAK